MRRRLLATFAILAAAAPPALLLTSSAASATPAAKATLVVSKPGSTCGPSQFTSINAALAVAPPNSTVVVCNGNYNEDAVVTTPLTLVGLAGAVVNPTTPVLQTNSPLFSQTGNNGITVTAPGVTIVGFKVVGATGDGILSVADRTTIVNATSNTNAGAGIDLNGSSFSTVKGSTANSNITGGIQLTNDAGGIFPGATASHDSIVSNVANNNVKGCGIILADHLGATVPGAQGIFGNVIRANSLFSNGTSPGAFGPGAGVVMASPVPGGAVYDNVIIDNNIAGSGLAGVTVHSHVAGQNFSGNSVTGNTIGMSNLLGDFADPSTTGIYVGSVSPLKIVVAANLIHNNDIGIFAAGPVAILRTGNTFLRVPTRLASTPVFAG